MDDPDLHFDFERSLQGTGTNKPLLRAPRRVLSFRWMFFLSRFFRMQFHESLSCQALPSANNPEIIRKTIDKFFLFANLLLSFTI